LPSVQLTRTFLIKADDTITLISTFDETKQYPQNKNITIPYRAYSTKEKTIINRFYLGGNGIKITENDTTIVIDNITYKEIGSASNSNDTLSYYELNPIAQGLAEKTTYYFMIVSQGANFTSIKGQLNRPLMI
jgi:hypothetical protein